MRFGSAESDFEHAACALPRVKNRAAAAFAMGVDHIIDRRIELDLRQRLNDQAALPRAVGGSGQMLQGAAAARAEMRTEREDAFCGRDFDLHGMAAIRVARPRLDLDGLPGKCIRHIDRTSRGIGDAVAARAEPADHKPLNHGTRQ